MTDQGKYENLNRADHTARLLAKIGMEERIMEFSAQQAVNTNKVLFKHTCEVCARDFQVRARSIRLNQTKSGEMYFFVIAPCGHKNIIRDNLIPESIRIRLQTTS